MIPIIPAIPSISATTAAGATQTGGSSVGLGATADTSPGSFQNILGQAIDSLSGVTNQANSLSLQAVTGQASVVDASVASVVATLDTQLASALASRAVTSLNAIMNMQL
jgi:flagellar hook-basal body complex protein FliE